MRDVFVMWRETRMVVLTAVTAAIYAATVIPLKIATVVPGFTEIRPGVAMVVVCSILFGPAAAWGAAFGNLIADFFGTLGLGSLFGFIGNFLFGYFPYKIFRSLTGQNEYTRSLKSNLSLLTAATASAWICAFCIGWGVDMLGLVPIQILGGVIALNNTTMSILIAPIVLSIIYERAGKWGITYPCILESSFTQPGKFTRAGLILALAGATGGLSLALLSGFNIIPVSIHSAGTLSPFIAAIIAGALLI